MLTPELRNQIDRVWEAFWTGGLTAPLTIIEQITSLLFLRRLDEVQIQKENRALLLDEPVQNPVYTEAEAPLRWSRFKNLDPDQMFQLFRKEEGVFSFLQKLGDGSSFARFMRGIHFMIPTSRLLSQVVSLLDKVDMEDQDTKGDVYEYILSKLSTAGQNGQFRTPRHIIKLMVELMEPTLNDVICDPAAGSCGFLVGAAEYLQEQYREELYRPEHLQRYQNDLFMGMEFDPTMIRIGAMNLILHGIENPHLLDVDSLSEANSDFREQATLILANPPFKGSLDYDVVENSILTTVKSKKTELLFLGLMLRGLQTGGRCAVIVPDGVLFGSSKAHLQIRTELVDKHQLQAVISMPSGVFKPYAGVSTAILIFTKTGQGGTGKVWFYDMKADGYSLDDKRQPTEANDIADIIHRFKHRESETESTRTRTEQSFFVTAEEIRENKYDLSINKYKEVVYEETHYDEPEEIIRQLEELEKEIGEGLKNLKIID